MLKQALIIAKMPFESLFAQIHAIDRCMTAIMSAYDQFKRKHSGVNVFISYFR